MTDPEGLYTPVETELFDGKCGTYIEGCRYIPAGDSWIRADGQVFTGEMTAPWKDSQALEVVQALYKEMDAIQAETDAVIVDQEYRLTLMELGINE